MNNCQIYLAPIQGITDCIFRNTFHAFFKGVKLYFAPYLRLDNSKKIKLSKLRDILPKNNTTPVVPQIMVNNSDDFIFMANVLKDYGYTDINWNLGCPYPMVTNRKLGAGLLPFHDDILNILDKGLSATGINLSVKLRSGLDDGSEIENLLPKLNNYPLSEIIIHPRYARQMYKGIANVQLFQRCIEKSNHKLCYNGDIDSLNVFLKYRSFLDKTDRIMLGRGIITNPFLAERIISNDEKPINYDIFRQFHDELLEGYLARLGDSNHVLMKMKALWEYFHLSFPEKKREYKKIKKAVNINKYLLGIKGIFEI